ncbi:MAG: ABC transporter substrate-binding protein [Paracoccaceae bacterium]
MVRQALAKALDRETYVKQAHSGYAQPGYGTINPAMAFFYDTEIGEKSQQDLDPEGAKALLAEAGFPGGAGFPELELITTRRRSATGWFWPISTSRCWGSR